VLNRDYLTDQGYRRLNALRRRFNADLGEDQRFKRATGKKFPDLLSQIKRYVGKKDVGIHFSDLPQKLGIYPMSKFNTPIGVYGYVLTPTTMKDLEAMSVSDVGGGKELSDFGNERKFIHLFRIKPKGGRIIHINKNGSSPDYTDKDWDRDEEKIKKIAGSSYKYSSAREIAKEKNAIARLWTATGAVSKNLVKWGSLLRELGITAIVDNGSATIHYNEPYQMVVLRGDALQRLVSGVNPHYNLKAGVGAKARDRFLGFAKQLEGGSRLQVQEAIRRLIKIGSKAIPVFVKALKSKNWQLRYFAARAIGKIEGKIEPRAIPALVEALKDKDVRVRREVVWTLGKIGPKAEKAVPALIEALKDKDFNVRYSAVAAMALGRIGPKAGKAVPALSQALKDKDVNIRMNAAEALGKIGPKAEKAVPALIEALKDKNEYVRMYATIALGKIGPRAEKAVPALIKALKDKNPNIRRYAAKALKQIKPGIDMSQYESIDCDSNLNEDEDRRLNALRRRVYADLGEDQRFKRETGKKFPDLLSQIKRYAGKKDIGIHFSKLPQKLGVYPKSKFLTPIGVYGYVLTPTTMRELEDMAGDSDFIGKELSTFATERKYIHFFKIRPRGGRIIHINKNGTSPDYSSKDWEEEESKIRMLVGGAYTIEMDDKVAAMTPVKALWFVTRAVSKNAVKWGALLRKLGITAIVDNGSATIHSNEPYQMVVLRGDALQRLVSGVNPGFNFEAGVGLKARENFLEIAKQLKDKNPNIRRYAAFNLGDIGPKAAQAVPSLIQVLGDKNEGNLIREFVVTALGKIGPKASKAVPELIKTLKDKSPNIRRYAAKALKKIKPGIDMSQYESIDCDSNLNEDDRRCRMLPEPYEIPIREFTPSQVEQAYVEQFNKLVMGMNQHPDRILDKDALPDDPDGPSPLKFNNNFGTRLNVEYAQHHGDPIQANASVPVSGLTESRCLTEARSKKLKKDLKLKSGAVHPKGTPVSVSYREVGYRWVAVLQIGGEEVKVNPKNLHVYIPGFPKPPTIRTLEKQDQTGNYKSVSGKRAYEMDGNSEDGAPTWMLVLGLV